MEMLHDANNKPKTDASNDGTQGALKRAAQGSKIKKHWNAAELRAKLAEMKLHIMAGLDDQEIQQMIGVSSVARYNELKKELYRQEQASLNQKSTEDVYLEYSWAQQQVIRELDDALANIPENQPNAVVGALRAKSEIIDKILKTGQDMGIINKEPERKTVLHGHVVANMSMADLRKAIVGETNQLAGALARYGEVGMGDADLPGSRPDAPTFTSQEKGGMNKSGPTKAEAARLSRQAVKRTKVIDVPE